MDISQVGMQSSLAQMDSTANTSDLSGTFAGLSVQVNETPPTSLADSAEELTFAKDNSKQTKLADRKQKQSMLDMTAKLKKLMEVVQAASNSDGLAQKRVLHEWWTQKGSIKSLLQNLENLGGHAASNYGFLLQVAEQETDSALKEQLLAAAQELFNTQKTAIMASLNALSMLDSTSFAGALNLSEAYSELVTNPKESQDILVFLQERYGADNLQEGIDLMFKALSADLMAAQSSREPDVLHDIASKLAQAKTINAALSQFTDFAHKAEQQFGCSDEFEPSSMLTRTLDLAKTRFITPLQINDLYHKGIETKTPEDEVVLGQEFMSLVRHLAVEVFASLEDRNKLLEATQKHVDILIDKEDEWLEQM